jgi:hypothetical protein
MYQVSRSKVEVTLRGHSKMLVRTKSFTCIKRFQVILAQMLIIWGADWRAQFRFLRAISMLYIEVKFQIKIWKCVKGPFSHHLFRDCYTNGNFHDYRCDTFNKGKYLQGQGHKRLLNIQISSKAYLLHYRIVRRHGTLRPAHEPCI